MILNLIFIVIILSLYSFFAFFIFGWIGGIYLTCITCIFWLIPSLRGSLGLNPPLSGASSTAYAKYAIGVVWNHLVVVVSAFPIIVVFGVDNSPYVFNLDFSDSEAFGDTIIPFLLAFMTLLLLRGLPLGIIFWVGLTLTCILMYVEFSNLVDYLCGDLPWGWEEFSLAYPCLHFYLLFTAEWFARAYIRGLILIVFGRASFFSLPKSSIPPILSRFVEGHLLNMGDPHGMPRSGLGFLGRMGFIGIRGYLVCWYYQTEGNRSIMAKMLPDLVGKNEVVSDKWKNISISNPSDFTIKLKIKDVSLPSLPAPSSPTNSVVNSVVNYFSD